METGQPHHAFSRTEFYALLSALAVLAATVLTALAHSREPGQRIGCVNNLRQLGVALMTYSSENDGMFPPRSSPFWPSKLQRFYGDSSVLRCPAHTVNSADTAPRSYIMNGWDDYFHATLDFPNWTAFQDHVYPFGITESAIPRPSETIAFGEKFSSSHHFHVDTIIDPADDVAQVEQSRHFRTKPSDSTSGGSNYAMADGSVRFLKFGAALVPVNLWFVLDPGRTNNTSALAQ